MPSWMANQPVGKTHFPAYSKSNLHYNQHVDIQTVSRYQNDVKDIVEMSVVWLDVNT